MSLYDGEFQEAFTKTLQKHPAINVDLGRSVLAKLQEFLLNESTRPIYDKQTYPELLRRALNHFHLTGENRIAYGSLAGAFFGKRGSRKAAAARRNGAKVKKDLPPATESDANRSVAVIMKGKQLTWDF